MRVGLVLIYTYQMVLDKQSNILENSYILISQPPC
jgi:hypothetical protein